MRRVVAMWAVLGVVAVLVGLMGCGGDVQGGGPGMDTAGKAPPPPPTPNTSDWIAFQALVGSGRNAGDQILTMGSDGSGVRQLTNYSAHSSNVTPSWNLSRTRICFRSSRSAIGVYTMKQDGSDQQLERPGPYGSFPDWCPAPSKATWIACHQDSVPAVEGDGIYVLDTAGPAGQGTKVSGTQHKDMYPTWSPDGNLIAFYGGSRSPSGLYVVPAAGGTVTYIGVGYYADWSPDGGRLAYTQSGDILYVNVNPATGAKIGDPVQVTDDVANGFGEHPTWSPDGLFVTCRLAGAVAKVNIATSQATPLYTTGERFSWPDWSLLP